MLTVHKYVLTSNDAPVVRVQMPEGAELLHVAEQRGMLCVWARVDTERRMVTRVLLVHGTGHVMASGDDALVMCVWRSLPHVGTVLMEQGSLVLHVFDAGPAA